MRVFLIFRQKETKAQDRFIGAKAKNVISPTPSRSPRFEKLPSLVFLLSHICFRFLDLLPSWLAQRVFPRPEALRSQVLSGISAVAQ